MKTQLYKTRNPIALAMYRMKQSTRIVKDKTKYTRKVKNERSNNE